jgi:hypothetical protein
LSLLYALLDGAKVISTPHMLAALAAWDYCEASAQFIFGDSLGYPEADRILAALRTDTQGLSRGKRIRRITMIRIEQFSQNVT